MINYPIIDLHCHLRNDIAGQTKTAKESGISTVVYMANSEPPLDNISAIKKSLAAKRNCTALPVSAITKNLEGKELVDVDAIKDFVIGFSDDGKYLSDLKLLAEILAKNVLVMAHCSPDYETSIKHPELETQYVNNYLKVLKKVGGRLHIQHVNKKSSVDLIRRAKKSGLKFSCETCPHYFTYTAADLSTKTNPPLGNRDDIIAIKKGLADGTIDVIASDHEPEPRVSGIAGFSSFIPLSYGLILSKVLSEKQLKEKLYLNPMRIIGPPSLKFVSRTATLADEGSLRKGATNY
ncbi:MAG: amidohydrolase family protein [Candidatus Berkelbacteria bacterium]|nr:amidohydrolase family protein [Candidatus Berkelbacteria bacterium]